MDSYSCFRYVWPDCNSAQDSRSRIGGTLLIGIAYMKSDLRVYLETMLRLEGKERLFSASRGIFVCTDSENKTSSSKEQCPSAEASSFLGNLEFVHILWNPIITVLTQVYHLFLS